MYQLAVTSHYSLTISPSPASPRQTNWLSFFVDFLILDMCVMVNQSIWSWIFFQRNQHLISIFSQRGIIDVWVFSLLTYSFCASVIHITALILSPSSKSLRLTGNSIWVPLSCIKKQTKTWSWIFISEEFDTSRVNLCFKEHHYEWSVCMENILCTWQC